MNIPGLSDISSASRQVATKSAMNPMLWASAIVTPLALTFSTMVPLPLNYMMFLLACVPPIVTCWGFRYFAKNDPLRLQSESHVQQMEILSKIGSNQLNQSILIDDTVQRGNINVLPAPDQGVQ